MKSECGRFEYVPEIGINDSLSNRYVKLTGEVIQIAGFHQVMFSEQTKKILNDFIEKISPFVADLDEKAKKERLKSNFYHDFKKVLNEGFDN